MNFLSILSPQIFNSFKKICIIGNSGADEEVDKEIEESDCVIRFNNYATRSGLKKTKDPYRCNILFSTFDLHSVRCAPEHVVIGIPFPFKAKEIYQKCDSWYRKSKIWMVNPYENMRMCEIMNINSLGYHHPIPSIGFTALWHISQMNLTKRIFVGGFEWYHNDETGLFQNFDLKKSPKPSNWNHDYHKELDFIIKYILPKNNIIFSKRCSFLLDKANSQLR